MNFENLTAEQMEKAKACKTPEELATLAESEGVELSDEQLEALSGGFDLIEWANECPKKDCEGYVEYNSCPKYTYKQEPLVI